MRLREARAGCRPRPSPIAHPAMQPAFEPPQPWITRRCRISLMVLRETAALPQHCWWYLPACTCGPDCLRPAWCRLASARGARPPPSSALRFHLIWRKVPQTGAWICLPGAATAQPPSHAGSHTATSRPAAILNSLFMLLQVLKLAEQMTASPPKSEADVKPLEQLISEAFQEIDKAVVKGIMHRNTAARKKARCSRHKKAVSDSISKSVYNSGLDRRGSAWGCTSPVHAQVWEASMVARAPPLCGACRSVSFMHGAKHRFVTLCRS